MLFQMVVRQFLDGPALYSEFLIVAYIIYDPTMPLRVEFVAVAHNGIDSAKLPKSPVATDGLFT